MRRLFVLLGVLLALPAAPAAAQQSPAGCTSNGFKVDTVWNPGYGRAGLPSTVSVVVSQSGTSACDVSGVTIDLYLPGANGAPSGTPMPLVEDATFRHDGPAVTYSREWVVALAPGVTAATARVTVKGTVLDGTGSTIDLDKTLSHPIAAPGLGFSVTADPAAGTAPLDVTYRFALTNTGTPAEPLSGVKLASGFCTPGDLSGDTDNDQALNGGETWIYTCTHRFTAAGEYTATANATAISTADGRPVNAAPVNTVVRVSAPAALGQLTLTAVASPAGGFAPLNVTYTYTVRNDGTGDVRDVTVADGGCAPVVATTAEAPLAPGATRTFTCTRWFDTAGTFSAGALASGIDVTSGRRVASTTITTELTTTTAAAAASAPPPVATVQPDADSEPSVTPARPRSATISTRAGNRKVARKTRTVTVATIACPAGATCSITAPRTAKLKLGRKTYTVTVSAAKTLAGGKRANVTLELPKAAYARLKSGKVTVRVSAKATGASRTSLTVQAAIRR